jgi:hypothetical protein
MNSKTNLTYNELNAKHQREHRAKIRNADPEQFKKTQAEKMREYRRKRIERESLLKPIVKVEEPIRTIDLTKFEAQPVKQTKGKKKAISNEIIPLHLRSNKEITEGSLNDYVSKLNIVHKLFVNIPLNTTQKEEIRKAIKSNKFDKTLINFSYFADIAKVIKKLRETYANDNTFRAYINAITVLLSRLDDFKKQYQLIAKVNIDFSKSYNEERDKHIIADEDKNKLISFTPEEINKNINKLTKIEDKVLYAFSVYLLRRLEIRFLKLEYEDNDDENKNLLIVDKKYNPSVVIFNEYKTAKVFKKQVVEIPDEIKALVKEYLITKKINIGDYVFGLVRNKKEYVSQGNFSTKIKTVFNKLYDANITNRWIRTAYATEKGGKVIDAVKEYEKDASKLSHSNRIHGQYIKKV